MYLNITINMDNASFKGDDDRSDYGAIHDQLTEIFKVLTEKVATKHTRGLIMDTNGNTVGSWGTDTNESVLTNCPKCDAYLTINPDFTLKLTYNH